MNCFRRISGGLVSLAAGLIWVGAGNSVQAAHTQGSATVIAVRGVVDYSPGGGSWTPLRRGTTLDQGAVVRTGVGSEADLSLGRNGSFVRITENSELALSALSYEDTGVETVIDTQLDLRSGRVLGSVPKLSATSKYEVKTPHSVAGIRGTRYDVRADGAAVVCDGSVIIVYYKPDGTTITRVVNARERFNAGTGLVEAAAQGDLSDVCALPAGRGMVAAAARPPALLRRTSVDLSELPDLRFDYVQDPVDFPVSRFQPQDQGLRGIDIGD
jgi:hypothetical protein